MSYKNSFFTLWEVFYLTYLSYNTDLNVIEEGLYSKGIKDILVDQVSLGKNLVNGLNAVIYSRYANNRIRYFLAVAGTSLPGKNQSKFKDLLRDVSNIASLIVNRTTKQSDDLEDFLLDFIISNNVDVVMEVGAHSLGCAVVAFVVGRHSDWFGRVRLIDGPGVQEVIEQVQPDIYIRQEIYQKLGIYNGLPNLINTFNTHPDASQIYCINKVDDKKIHILQWDFSGGLVLTASTHSLEHLSAGVAQGKVRKVDSSWYNGVAKHLEWPDSMLSKYTAVLGQDDEIQIAHTDSGEIVGVLIEEDTGFWFGNCC